MALTAGTRFGAYEITGQLGAGGMGEVYRARDAKLKRDVAIKVLPPAFADDPERLARFEREATVLASLNHPNIASVYGLEDSGGPALVMELVEGPTLAERIRRGPIPVEEGLSIAQQMAEAFEYAHEQGVIHRDLKPANVKVGDDDTVKILDFGLAKALQTGGAAAAELPNSPTTLELATRAGVLLGTAAYMSPEQAKGKRVDRRTDIWAFGCVLYEMLTGDSAFHGEAVADTLAAVIRAEPDWSQLPSTTPQPVRVLLRRCLNKDPRQRLQAMGEARIALDEVLSGRSPPDAGPARPTTWLSRSAWSLGAAFIAASAASLVVWNLRKPAPAPPLPVTRFTITLPPGQRLATSGRTLVLSADGSRLAYVASQGNGPRQLYLWSLDRMEAQAVPGTEGAGDPFFSPDGEWVGFVADGKLEKISVRGGVAQALADIGPYSSGVSWSRAHTIAFAPYSSSIQEVSDAGGEPRPLTHFQPGETLHTWPSFLPGDKAVLFTAVTSGPSAIAVQRIDTGERRNLLQSQGSVASYAPSGHLVFLQNGNLMAAPFDRERLKVDGAAVPAVHDVMDYSVSATGSLAYASGAATAAANQSTLVWVTRDTGAEQPLDAPARFYNQPRLSPDGGLVAVDVVDNVEDMQVWLYDVARDRATPFTFEGSNRHAVWTPDGKRVAFMSNREGPTQIFWKLADGSGGLERLTDNPPTTTADILDIPYSWSPDGKLLTFVKVVPAGMDEFWVLQVGGAGRPTTARRFPGPIPAVDGAPELSPDGHWLAYASEESGHGREIYVQAFPGPGGKWQISTGGGNEPQWNRNGRELFYRSGAKMMAVDIDTKSGFSWGKPHELFAGNYRRTGEGWVRANYDVSPDGQRFLMLKPAEQEQASVTQINVVLNWSEELKRLAPTR